jgi:hypothetical protein
LRAELILEAGNSLDGYVARLDGVGSDHESHIRIRFARFFGAAETTIVMDLWGFW